MAVLALATGVGLLWTARTLGTLTSSPPATGSATSTADAETNAAVRRFYAAANEVLRTGDTGRLSASVTPAFAAHDGSYAASLVRMRASCPACHLEPGPIAVDFDLATATVTIVGSRWQSALGLPMDEPASAPVAYDRLRVEDGRIAEIWPQQDDFPFLLCADVPFSVPAAPSVVQVATLMLRPGAALAAMVGPGDHLFLVKTGYLTVRSTGSVAAQSPPEQERVLGPGEHSVAAAGTPHAVRNMGEIPVEVVMVAVYPYTEPGPENDTLLPGQVLRKAAGSGVSGRVVATALLREPTGERALIGAEHMSLALGTGIGEHDSGIAEIVIVETGALALTAGAETTRLTWGPDYTMADRDIIEPEGSPHVGGAATLAGGDAAVVQRGIVEAIRPVDDVPASFLIVRIESTDAA
jgi:hypothetical protein